MPPSLPADAARAVAAWEGRANTYDARSFDGLKGSGTDWGEAAERSYTAQVLTILRTEFGVTDVRKAKSRVKIYDARVRYLFTHRWIAT